MYTVQTAALWSWLKSGNLSAFCISTLGSSLCNHLSPCERRDNSAWLYFQKEAHKTIWVCHTNAGLMIVPICLLSWSWAATSGSFSSRDSFAFSLMISISSVLIDLLLASHPPFSRVCQRIYVHELERFTGTSGCQHILLRPFDQWTKSQFSVWSALFVD